MTVTPSATIASSTALGSNRGTIDRQPPNRTVTSMIEDSPKTWKKGSTASVTSSLLPPKSRPETEQFM